MTSTTAGKPAPPGGPTPPVRRPTAPSPHRRGAVWAALFWLVAWQVAAMAMGNTIILVSPVAVVARLFTLAQQAAFWQAVGFSFIRIVGGFLAAVVLGVALAAAAARFAAVASLLSPLMLTIKATPVASFIILMLVWVSTKNLSVLISFLMVLPIVYTNILQGVQHTNPQLLEMAAVFRLPFGRRLRYIYLSQVLPYFQAACGVALGLCWKAGVAAEIIGVPGGSIGERLYMAKIYLQTPDVFAWTLVIILISLLFEKLFMLLVRRGIARLERR